MSVNEVRNPKAKEAFVVRGSGPANNRTFCIGDEDHTIGNSLRHVLMQNQRVSFAGYSVPHPSEPVVQIRVQTIQPSSSSMTLPPPPAVELLKEGCQTLIDQCDIVLERLETVCPETRDDRLEMERKFLEYEEAGEEEEGMVVEEDAEMMQE